MLFLIPLSGQFSILPQFLSVAHTEWEFLSRKMSTYLQTMFPEPRLSVLGLTWCLSFKRAALTCLFFVSGDNAGHKGYMTDGLQQNSYYLVWDHYRHLNKICILLQIRGSLGVGRWWCQQQECGNKTKHREGNLYSNLLKVEGVGMWNLQPHSLNTHPPPFLKTIFRKDRQKRNS